MHVACHALTEAVPARLQSGQARSVASVSEQRRRDLVDFLVGGLRAQDDRDQQLEGRCMVLRSAWPLLSAGRSGGQEGDPTEQECMGFSADTLCSQTAQGHRRTSGHGGSTYSAISVS